MACRGWTCVSREMQSSQTPTRTLSRNSRITSALVIATNHQRYPGGSYGFSIFDTPNIVLPPEALHELLVELIGERTDLEAGQRNILSGQSQCRKINRGYDPLAIPEHATE
jgi:hypothetical protein